MLKHTYVEHELDVVDIFSEFGIATSGILQDWDENIIYQETF